jgi:multidrug efflux pump subunit AcrA (membrane-fusion protein)
MRNESVKLSLPLLIGGFFSVLAIGAGGLFISFISSSTADASTSNTTTTTQTNTSSKSTIAVTTTVPATITSQPTSYIPTSRSSGGS